MAATKRPLVAATNQEHFDDHVGQVWAGIFQREERLVHPSLYVNGGRLAYLAPDSEGDYEIAPSTPATASPSSPPRRCSGTWATRSECWRPNRRRARRRRSGNIRPPRWTRWRVEEHGWVTRETKQRKDEPDLINYVLRTPKRHHPAARRSPTPC